MRGVAIDPGVWGCGVAVFDLDTKTLEWAAYGEGEDFLLLTPGAVVWRLWGEQQLTEAVIERPEIRRTAQQKGDQRDIRDLLLVTGGIASLLLAREVPVRLVSPETWKGQVPKAVMGSRILTRLSEEERERVVYPAQKALRHNVLDAVGIGLWARGRL